MNCSDLKENRPVVFKIFSDILNRKIPMDGSVISVNQNEKTVCVGYMEGYRYRTETIPYADMIAAYDENGKYMKFENISGPSVLLQIK